jgi:hypothetical protein
MGDRLQGLKALISIPSLRSLSRTLRLNPRRRAAPDAALPAFVRDGLVAELRFDEGAGQVVGDYTGNGHNGLLGFTAGVDPFDPTWTARGLSFDGTEAAWFADALGVSGGAPRTVIAVVKTGSSAEFGMEWNGTGGNGERWALDRSGAGTLRLDIRGANFTSALALPAGAWCSVAATQSGANLDTVTLYLNGSSEASGVSATIDTTNGFIVGQASSVTKQMEAAYVLVYNRALSAAEVERNHWALTSILAGRGITLPW